MGNPTVTPLAEVWHAGGFIDSEANGHRSREAITLVSGAGKLNAGTVLGQITTGATAASAALGTNTGNGTFGAVTLVTTPTQIGTYTVVWSTATAFTVTAPDGQSATGTNGNAFSALGIGFTMTTGATPMVAGDSFSIVTTDGVATVTAAATAGASNTGNTTCGSVTCTGHAPMPGVHKVTIVEPGANVGTFVVEDPLGRTIGHGAVATAFSGGGLSFTIADGSTDFVSGDQFTVTVAAGSGKYKAWDPGNVDGSQIVAGILFAGKDATSADKAALAMVRSCEVNQSELVWPTGMNAATIALGVAGLKALGIICR